MKVELLVNLKSRSGSGVTKVWRQGVYSDPVPPGILGEVEAGADTVRVLDDPVPKVAAEKPQAAATETVNEKPEPPAEEPAEKNEVQDPIDDGSTVFKGEDPGKPPAEKLDAIIEKTRYPKLHALIKQKGSVAETARSLGVSTTTVNNWKKGKTKPNKAMLAKISRMVRNDKNRTDDTGDGGS